MGTFGSQTLPHAKLITILAATGVVLGAIYMLWLYQRTMFGKLDREENRGLRDLSPREIMTLLPLTVAAYLLAAAATQITTGDANAGGPAGITAAGVHVSMGYHGHHRYYRPYYYGHYYAAGCIEQLPAAEQPYYQDHLAAILMPLQEKDGSWWDYPFYNYHQQYGTAMAISSLEKCLKK